MFSNEKRAKRKGCKEHVNQGFCPNFYKLIQVTIASSVGRERSFAAMRRIKIVNYEKSKVLKYHSSSYRN